MHETGCLPSVAVQSEREVVRTINTRKNFLDYYLWGHMRTLVYKTKVESKAALHDRIFAAAEHICNNPDNVASATQSLLMRAEKCIATGGGH